MKSLNHGSHALSFCDEADTTGDTLWVDTVGDRGMGSYTVGMISDVCSKDGIRFRLFTSCYKSLNASGQEMGVILFIYHTTTFASVQMKMKTNENLMVVFKVS